MSHYDAKIIVDCDKHSKLQNYLQWTIATASRSAEMKNEMRPE